MKVNSTEPELSAQMALWIAFLRVARKVTYQSLAVAHGTQRSNLSAFISSGGRTRNISFDKLRNILFELGLLSDGTLAPGLHRWTVGEGSVQELSKMLVRSAFERGYVFESGRGGAVFLVVQVASNILVFVELDGHAVGTFLEGLDGEAEKVIRITLDRAGASEIQALWMTQDDAAVTEHLASLIELFGPA